MSQLTDLFAAIERALFEVLTWVVIIPRTLYLVLANPTKVPEYVHSQLDPEDQTRQRFEGSISPVFLFLLVALGPQILIQLVSIPRLPIEGDAIGVVNEESVFTASFVSAPNADYSKGIWTVEQLGPDDFWYPLEDASEEHCYVAFSVVADCDELELAMARERFATLVDYEQRTIDEAHTEVSEQFSRDTADVVASEWCQVPVSSLVLEQCATEHAAWGDALDEFFDLVSESDSAELAAEALSASYGDEIAAHLFTYWCSAPPGPGCPQVGAWDRFEALVYGEGRSAVQARDTVALEFGSEELADEILDWWCSPPPELGCQQTQAAAVIDDGALEDSYRRSWSEPGSYRVSLQVDDMKTGSLIDRSEYHQIDVSATKATSAQRSNRARQGAADERRDRPTLDERAKQILASPSTTGWALLLLAFPLIMTSATELRRGRELTQATIKPAFYIQCLYLSPLIFAIWIPILLSNYSPTTVDQVDFAILLALVIVIWFLRAEIRFVASERAIAKSGALLWLAVPLLIILVPMISFVATFVGLHEYVVVERIGTLVMALMLLPFLVATLQWLWRLVARRGPKGAS